MADLTIADIRQKYPQYNDMSDAALADGLHQKFYSDMPFDAFAGKIGFKVEQPPPDMSRFAETGGGPTSEDITKFERGMPPPTTLMKANGARLNEPTGATEYAPPAEPGGSPVAMGARPQSTVSLDDYAGTGAEGMKPDAESIGSALGRIGGAVDEGFRKGAAAGTDIQGQPLLTGLMRQGGGVVGGITKGLAQSAMETFGDRLGRDVLGWLAAVGGPEAAIYPRGLGKAPAPEAAAPRFVSEATAPDVSGLDSRNAIQALLTHDIMENGPGLPGRGQSLAEAAQPVLNAPDLDSAIRAAADASGLSPRQTVGQIVAANPGMDVNEAYRQAALVDRTPMQRPVAREATVPPEQPALTGNVLPPEASTEGLAQRLGAPESQSVGSAASREGTPASEIALSTADMKANRRQAEKGLIQTPAERGDRTIYVEGSIPTRAEYSGDPEVSQREIMLRQLNPHPFESETGRLTQNMRARTGLYDELTPSDTALRDMDKAASAKWEEDVAPIATRAQPADLSPAETWLTDLIDHPRNQERSAIRKVFEPLREKLYDPRIGALKTDPQSVWGMHDELIDMLNRAKNPLDASSAESYAIKELVAYKDIIDDVMNKATGGQFQTALDNFAAAKQIINAGEILRENRDKIIDMHGRIRPQQFHNFVLGLAEARGRKGIDPAMDISDHTMDALMRIDADLKRAGLIDLGKARGSPTYLFSSLGQRMGVGALQVAAHTAVAAATHGLGNALVSPLIKAGFERMSRNNLERLTREHLAEPPEGYRQLAPFYGGP